MEDLGLIVKLNGYCYKEAMNYCVYKMYPNEQDLLYNAEQVEGTLTGTAVCGIGLSLQVVTKKVIAPTFNAIWYSIVLKNILLFIVLLLLIVLAIVQRRRR